MSTAALAAALVPTFLLSGICLWQRRDKPAWIFPLLALSMLCGALAGCAELNMVPPEKAEQGFAILRGAEDLSETALVKIDSTRMPLFHHSARITPGGHLVVLSRTGGGDGDPWAVLRLDAKAGHEYVVTSERETLTGFWIFRATWIMSYRIVDKTTGEVVARKDFRCHLFRLCDPITE